jgi:hypothetical protein
MDETGGVKVKIVSHEVALGFHHIGIVVEDNMGKGRTIRVYSGGPDRMFPLPFGRLEDQSGMWRAGQDDFDAYDKLKKITGKTRVYTLVDDTSSFDGWIKKFDKIRRFLDSAVLKPYHPIPLNEDTANSNTLAKFYLEMLGLDIPFYKAVAKDGYPALTGYWFAGGVVDESIGCWRLPFQR